MRRLEMDLQRLSVENMELRQIAEDDDRKNQPPIGYAKYTLNPSQIQCITLLSVFTRNTFCRRYPVNNLISNIEVNADCKNKIAPY